MPSPRVAAAFWLLSWFLRQDVTVLDVLMPN